ncbi:hypothetical protein [Streptomyces sp. NPDC048172]|uniref:hypothetical protein n=1 Tax=Streptomyces sp. NPDC048172 TaxID=3365505 RepID=UPI003714628F
MTDQYLQPGPPPLPQGEPPRKSWIARHKFLTVLLAALAVVVIVAVANAAGGGDDSSGKTPEKETSEEKAKPENEKKEKEKAKPEAKQDKPVVLAGQGKKVTRKAELSGDYVARMAVRGNLQNGVEGNFIVTGHGPGIESGLADEAGLANEITSGGTFEAPLKDLDGQYYFSVEATGSWTITLTPN